MYSSSQIPPTTSVETTPGMAPQMASFWSSMMANPHLLYQPLSSPMALQLFTSPPSYGSFWNSPMTSSSFSTPSSLWNSTTFSGGSPIDQLPNVSSEYSTTSSATTCTSCHVTNETPTHTRKRRSRSKKTFAKRQKSSEIVDVVTEPSNSGGESPEVLAKRRPRVVLGRIGKRRFTLRLMA